MLLKNNSDKENLHAATSREVKMTYRQLVLYFITLTVLYEVCKVLQHICYSKLFDESLLQCFSFKSRDFCYSFLKSCWVCLKGNLHCLALSCDCIILLVQTKHFPLPFFL